MATTEEGKNHQEHENPQKLGRLETEHKGLTSLAAEFPSNL